MKVQKERNTAYYAYEGGGIALYTDGSPLDELDVSQEEFNYLKTVRSTD